MMPDDKMIHIWAGNLLFNTGSFTDAVSAYSNTDDINQNF